MYRIDKPIENPESIFLKCIAKISDLDLKSRLEKCNEEIRDSAIDFENKIAVNELYKIDRLKGTKKNKDKKLIASQVTIQEMQNVYTAHFVPKGTDGRALYEKILTSSKSSICPLCGHREVKTLDHYLPKAYYPILSVVLINLLPSCSDCNKAKKVDYPSKQSEETFHPYFDNIDNEVWLKASVLKTTPVSINFFVQPPSSWSILLSQRIKYHFESFELNKLYSIQAAVELNDIRHGLNDSFENGGLSAVKNDLTRQALTRTKNNLNSWKAALYRALSTDDWFCDGGFNF